jgi:peptide/nickel transport system ATP-binding protein
MKLFWKEAAVSGAITSIRQADTAPKILSVEDVSVVYRLQGVFGGKKRGRGELMRSRKVLENINLSIARGEILGLAGESGSGKTTLARAVLGLLPYTGTIVKKGLTQAVFQDPAASLNPMFSVGRLLEEPLLINKKGTKKERLNYY